jgi:aminoglycoside phosphotransferase (APT) family kinase protein
MEATGLAAARGRSLVHFDMYAHNILLTGDQVLFVDWPHARLGAPFVDVVILPASAAADGVDPEPFIAISPLTASVDPRVIDGLLAAHAGFCMHGALSPLEAGLEPVFAAKRELGLAAAGWLQRRLLSR